MSLMKKVDFFKDLEIFKEWSKVSVTKISYLFSEVDFSRNQVVFREGQEAKFIYVVSEGEFESVKEFKLYQTSTQEKEVEDAKSIFRGRSVPNLMKNKQPPSQKSFLRKSKNDGWFFLVFGLGAFIADEDAFLKKKAYSSSVKWISDQAKLFYVESEIFIKRLKSTRKRYFNFAKSICLDSKFDTYETFGKIAVGKEIEVLEKIWVEEDFFDCCK